MKRPRAKLPQVTTFHYNTRSSSRHGNREISVGIAETPSASSLRVTRRQRKKNSDDQSTISDLLPIDLIMEILKRLPIKTLGRLLCVSKFYASIIRRRDFIKLFLSQSSTRPSRLFVSFNREETDCFIFSLLLGDVPSTVATYHVTHRASERYRISSSSVHGLVCYANASGSGLVVYNSSSRRTVTLPEFEPGSFVHRHFLGYDPVDGVYKVLCMTGPSYLYYVLTLGNGSSWKMIENSPVHMPANSQIICINGAVYCEAIPLRLESIVVSFDVRCENFQVIKKPAGTTHMFNCMVSTLISYEGKLGILSTKISANGNVDLWVLEDSVKQIWLKKVFVLPNTWTSLAAYISIVTNTLHCAVNITYAGELILAPRCLSDLNSPYYVICYDPKRNSVRKVVLEGIIEHELLHCEDEEICSILCIYSNQVESLMFL